MNSSETRSIFNIPWAQVALALSTLLASFAVSIANAALPTLAKVFDASFSQVQWIVLAYLLAITIMVVSAGRLGDTLGRRRVFLAGIFIFTSASFFCGAAPTLRLLITARAVQGLGRAVLIALSLALVSETVPKQRIGRTIGLLGSMSAIGTALGPSLSGVLIAGFGWRAIFIIMVPLGTLEHRKETEVGSLGAH
jgi:MFS family permease